MRKVLIISPHFPPVDAVDMHRVRMNVGHYPEFGWQPTVLTVKPEDSGRTIDDRLCETLPEGLAVKRVGAISEHIAKLFGVSAIGFRAHRTLGRAGDAFLRDGKFDLVFFSTTAFPIMTLGPRWRKRFNVPYVLDLQDPWYTFPSTVLHQSGAKHRLMWALHRRMERNAVPKASGLIAVSKPYINVLRTTYHLPDSLPGAAIPFGFSENDFEKALSITSSSFEKPKHRPIVCAYAGRINPAMTEGLRLLLKLIRNGINICESNNLLDNLSFIFLGTGYQSHQNPNVAEPIASSLGLSKMVFEHPDRIPFLDTQRELQNADILLILGSDDFSYQPSKLFPYLYLGKPLICVAPENSRLAKQVHDLDGVLFLATDQAVTNDSTRKFLQRLNEVVRNLKNIDLSKRQSLVQSFEARNLAKQECEIFDRATQYV